MFTKEQEKYILDLVNKQTKYKTKVELLTAIKEYLIKNMPNVDKQVKGR